MKPENYKSKISPRNKKFAEKIKTLSENYSIIGVVDVSGLPAPQFQRIRSKLHKTARILIVKRNLIDLVLKEIEKKHSGISKLIEKCSGVVGLVFTNDNPFTLYKFVKKNKSSAPAKAGQIAPTNIVVPAGPTGFSPGPIIGELGKFKIVAGINAGKVEIKQDCVVAKEGDTVSSSLAGILSRLGIEPMEVGLNIKGIYEEGILYDRTVLDVDEKEVLNNFKNAASSASALARGIMYPTKELVAEFVGNAAREALVLGVELNYPAAETISKLFVKAQSQMASVSCSLPEEIRPAGLSVSTTAPVVAQENGASNEESTQNEQKKETPEVDAASGLGALF